MSDDDARTGVCHGGPLDGTTRTSRYPRGALLLDRPAGHCWLYDWNDDGGFYVRADEPMPIRDQGDDNRWRAAEEGDFDVWAAPWVGGDPDAVDAYADEPDGQGDGDQGDELAAGPGVDANTGEVRDV